MSVFMTSDSDGVHVDEQDAVAFFVGQLGEYRQQRLVGRIEAGVGWREPFVR